MKVKKIIIVRIKLIVVDNYLSFEHGLFGGMEMDAEPIFTSTKKLKGYRVKSAKRDNKLFIKIEEIELIKEIKGKQE